MIVARYKQSARDNRKRVLDYSEWLEDGETIEDVTATVTPETDTPLAVSPITIDSDGDKFAYFVSGGEEGTEYEIALLVTTTIQVREDTVEIEIE